MTERRDYSLELPAVPASLALARLFVATVLRVHGVDETGVGDAKLAVSELASSSVVDADYDQVTVDIAVDGGIVTVEVRPVPTEPAGDSRERLDVVSALFPNAAIRGDGRAQFSIDLAVP